jgi:hypothetical protein
MNEIVKSDQEMLAEMGSTGYTGMEDVGGSSIFPPTINILQSDKQYECFPGQEDEIKKSMYGKLFIRRDRNSVDELMDNIKGIILKIQTGHEVLREENGKKKIISSSNKMIGKREKDDWSDANPGLTYRNMVKIILCPEYDIEIVKGMIDAGQNPFCLLAIKGGAWPSWFEAQNQMNALAMASDTYQHKRASELVAPSFSLDVSSIQTANQDGVKYWIPAVKIFLNDIKTAYGFNNYAIEFKDLNLFGRVAADIKRKETASVSGEAVEEYLDYESLN